MCARHNGGDNNVDDKTASPYGRDDSFPTAVVVVIIVLTLLTLTRIVFVVVFVAYVPRAVSLPPHTGRLCPALWLGKTGCRTALHCDISAHLCRCVSRHTCWPDRAGYYRLY